ncbi:hypothetical protein N7478_000975 [Penicillium angulare]|uniref:uncharacterized protein n=1 Tax=Penicillium angulare TaxID=116970 RepID=UPI00253FD066|nr:uncharacterized protein N7478_000975 [Penicillium angulare]KAJ5291724.1 hypothetical protein N7478_000975 [Penicillium angulare]
MAPDEYSTGGGGKLKLKGSKVSDGRVDKKKKKSKKNKDKGADSAATATENADTSANANASAADAKRELNEDAERELSAEFEGTPEGEKSAGKTETERKYEEVRRKRLHERLQRDGIKTHKERVEELNKYLSRLSEHHDMPKIGPG